MEDKINRIQIAILIGFVCTYAIALLVNAFYAVSGKATFAYWHIVPAAALAVYAWNRIPQSTRCRLVDAVAMTVKKTARVLLCTMRAVRSLPALFIQSYREYREAQL